jgi:TPR repeat protein
LRRLAALVLAGLLGGAQPLLAQAPDGGRVTSPVLENVDPGRFSERPADLAYGAYQRGYYLTALRLATPLALAGNPAAQTLIAEIYSRGLGVKPDLVTAMEWYEKASEQKVPEATFQLAMILLDGGPELGDRERAYELMKQAADTGHRLAQFNYAQMSIERVAGTRGFEEAVRYYERAAEAGLPEAQYAMAQVRMRGADGKTIDGAKVREWLEKAASQGFDTAQIDLGTWLVEHGGSAAEQEKGFGWLMRAARAGNPAAQNRVAKLYRAGVGVEADRVQSAVWYLRARRAGLIDPLMEDQLQGLTEEEIRLATLDADRLR